MNAKMAALKGAGTPVRYLSTAELATRWAYHGESVRRLIRQGRVPAIRLGDRLRIALADIERIESEGRIQR